jgi:hypothetical protein
VPPGEPWPLDVLTPEYLISGEIEAAAQKWGWSYFSPLEKRPARQLELRVTEARSTGARPAPPLAGTYASFAYGTAFVALISRGGATDAVWEEWAAAIGSPVPAEVFVGPYAITGSFLSADGTLSVLLNDRIPVRDATIVRIDGAGDGAPIQAARAVVATAFVQTAVVAGR